jgi:hypothetical protein
MSASREIAMLTILLATCETALDTLKAADNPIDTQLVVDLERVVARTRKELERWGSVPRLDREHGARAAEDPSGP